MDTHTVNIILIQDWGHAEWGSTTELLQYNTVTRPSWHSRDIFITTPPTPSSHRENTYSNYSEMLMPTCSGISTVAATPVQAVRCYSNFILQQLCCYADGNLHIEDTTELIKASTKTLGLMQEHVPLLILNHAYFFSVRFAFRKLNRAKPASLFIRSCKLVRFHS